MIDEMRQRLETAARPWGVKPDVHPDDFIFDFLINNPVFDSQEHAIEYYFNDGANSARKLGSILQDICKLGAGSFSLLEFASGYGCVSRHLGHVLPNCSLTVCDIHPEAVRFSEKVLGVEAIHSTSRPEDFPRDQQFDVVFALSFFSHMPKTTFTRWLRTLACLVGNPGFLLFTTHGLGSIVHIPQCEFDSDGYYFTPSSEQKDLDVQEYGTSLVKPEYVLSQIFGLVDCSLHHFHETYWWEHQDLYILRRGELN